MPESKRMFISVRELAEELGIGENQAYKLAAEGKIPCFRSGSRYIVPVDGLNKYNEILGILAAAKTAGVPLEEIVRLTVMAEAAEKTER